MRLWLYTHFVLKVDTESAMEDKSSQRCLNDCHADLWSTQRGEQQRLDT